MQDMAETAIRNAQGAQGTFSLMEELLVQSKKVEEEIKRFKISAF
jgi:hypothetical protein